MHEKLSTVRRGRTAALVENLSRAIFSNTHAGGVNVRIDRTPEGMALVLPGSARSQPTAHSNVFVVWASAFRVASV